MSNDFDYAHSNKNVIWMSQNTNHLPTHTAIQEAIKKSSDEREYTKYPLASGLPELRQLILDDLNLPNQDLHITNGGTEALYCLMRHIQPKGTEMITSDPSYFVVHKFAKLGGAKCTSGCRFCLSAAGPSDPATCFRHVSFSCRHSSR